MERFKLLAVRPLEKCDNKFTKILKTGEVYRFCNDFTFVKKDENNIHSPVIKVLKIDIENNIEQIYNVGHLSIAVSAIVARNGYGKSTLTELLFAAIYILSVEKDVLKKQSIEFLKKEKTRLEGEKKVRQSPENKPSVLGGKEKEKIATLLAGKNGLEEIKKVMLSHESKRLEYEQDGLSLDNKIKAVEGRQKSYIEMLKGIKVEIFYAIEGKCFCLRVDSENSEAATIIEIESNFPFKDNYKDSETGYSDNVEMTEKFFYTIAINYSHYSMNSINMGDWVQHLFHKNDGYKTPIVVNPMRTKGMFNINDETIFAKYRLLSNSLVERLEQKTKSPIFVTEKQYIKYVRFKVNNKKLTFQSIKLENKSIGGDERDRELVKHLLTLAFPGAGEARLYRDDLPFVNEVVNYLRQKVDRISETYEEYSQGFEVDESGISPKNDVFFKNLLDEDSHIGYKLRQALNFLRNNILNEDVSGLIRWDDPKKDIDGSDVFEYTLDQLLEWMNFEDIQDIIRHMPPSIFSIEFVLSENEEASFQLESTTEGLSSGELQLIHSTHSIIYHLLNIESVHKKTDSGIKYNYVNIIFDEVELYFHPDYQRKFVNNLLTSISRLSGAGMLRNIRGLNFIFSTHSPFILSDILKENVLLLKRQEGKSVPAKSTEQTFGANIHDLLANEFFMKNFIGEWAKSKIDGIIKTLNYLQVIKKIETLNSEKIKDVGKINSWINRKRHLETEIVGAGLKVEDVVENGENYEKGKHLYDFISLIGEPIIRLKMMSMLDSLYGDDKFRKLKKLERLAKELEMEIIKKK